jgi:hypothetical protein
MVAEQLVSLFCNGTLYSFERASEHTASWFGGPCEHRFKGIPVGPRPLHKLAHLDQEVMRGLGTPHRVFSLPLLYGLNFSGCEVTYRVAVTEWVEVLELDPEEQSVDFPYPNYPAFLPYAPLRASGSRWCTYREFAEDLPNMADEQPAELLVAVPPPATLGFSMWGPDGDREGVTVVFECDLAERTIRAYNRCT